MGLIGLITCGLWTFIWGWIKHQQLEMTKIMMIWTGSTVLSMALSIVTPLIVGAPLTESIQQIMGDKEVAVKRNPIKPNMPKATEKKKILFGVKGAEILRAGIYRVELSEERVKNKLTKDGERIPVKHYSLIKETNDVTPSVGTFLGFEYRIIGGPPGKPVLLKIHHKVEKPSSDPFKPDTLEVVHESDTNEEARIGDVQLVTFEFRTSWDLVPGQWTFELIHKDKKLAEKIFQVEVKKE